MPTLGGFLPSINSSTILIKQIFLLHPKGTDCNDCNISFNNNNIKYEQV